MWFGTRMATLLLGEIKVELGAGIEFYKRKAKGHKEFLLCKVLWPSCPCWEAVVKRQRRRSAGAWGSVVPRRGTKQPFVRVPHKLPDNRRGAVGPA